MTTPKVYAHRLTDPNLNVTLKATIANELRNRIDVFQTSEYADFLETLVPVFIQVLQTVPPTFVSNVPEQKLRNIILEIISRLPQTEHLKKYAAGLCKVLVDLLRVENEDNALVCVKVISDLHRTFRVLFGEQEQTFLEVVQEILKNMEQTVKDAFDTPSTPAGSATPGLQGLMAASPRIMSPATNPEAPPKSLPKGMNSFKVLGECPMIIILLFRPRRQDDPAAKAANAKLAENITKIVPLILETLSLQAKPQAEAANAASERGEVFVGVNPEIRNRSVFRQFIAAQAKVLSLLVRTNPMFLKPYLAQIPDIVTRLLRECPPESSLTRKELLIAMRHILQTEIRQSFVKSLDLLLNEKVLIGNGVTSHDILRPLAYSMLADLVHHIRSEITPAQLSRVIYIYSRNIHDATLAPNIQTMCGKLLLNLVERSTKIPNKSEGRSLLMRIMEAFASKFEALDTQFQSCLKQYQKTSTQSESSPGTSELDRAPPIHTNAAVQDASFDGVKEGRFLFKTLATGLRPLFIGLQSCNPLPQPEHGTNLEMYTKYARGFTKEEVNIVLRLFRAAIVCFEYYNVDNYDSNGAPINNQTQGSHGTDPTGISSTKKDRPLPDKEMLQTLEMFPRIFPLLDPAVFQEIVESQIEFLFERMVINPALIHIAKYFLVKQTMSRELADILTKEDTTEDRSDPLAKEAASKMFAGTVAQFLMERLDQLGDKNPYTSSLMLQLFQLLFAAVVDYPEANGIVLQPHVKGLVEGCFKFAARASTPEHYFLVLRALFKSIISSRSEILKKEMEPLLGLLLENLNQLITLAHKPRMRNLYVDLCLTVPVRLEKQLPYLPYLRQPLVIALKADPELVSQGLHTLELYIDNLMTEFLESIMEPVMKDLLEALWSHLNRYPHIEQISHVVTRILGKLGGRNRRTLKAPPQLTYNQRTECGISVDITLDSNVAPRSLSLDALLQISIKTLERPDATAYDQKQAYEFIKTSMVLMLDLDAGPDTLAQSLHPRISEQLTMEKAKSAEDSELSAHKNSESSVTGKTLADDQLQPKRLSGNGYTKYFSKRLAQEDSLRAILVSIMRASTIEEMQGDAWPFFENICKHFMIIHIGEVIEAREGGSKPLSDMMDERLAVQSLNTTLLVDAVAEAMASGVPQLQERAKKAIHICYDTAAQILGGKGNAWHLPIFRVFASQFCSYCYKQEWLQKQGGCLGVSIMSSELDIGTQWMREHELEFVRSLLFVLKDASPDITNINTADATQTLSYVLKVCNQPEEDESPEIQTKFQNLVALLVSELSNSNTVVRETIRSSLQLLADLTGNEVTELLVPVRERLVAPIFAKPIRSLALPMQIGNIDAITYCLALRPPFLEFNDGLIRWLQDAIGSASAPDEALVDKKQRYQNSKYLVNLRVACIKLLSAAMACPDFSNHSKPTTQNSIISVFFKSLSSESPDVIEAAHRGLKQVLSQQQRFEKGQLHNGLGPTLKKLSNHKTLTVPGLESLARLLELFTNYFKVEIGKKLLEHLQSLVDERIPQWAVDTSRFDGTEDKVIIALLNIFHLLPAGAHIFMDKLVGSVLQMERHLRRSMSSPFRPNLIKYFNRYPAETVAYFYEKLEVPEHNKLFVDVLSSKKAIQVREELVKTPDELINKTFKVEDKPELHFQGVLIVQSILLYEPSWLHEQPEILECLLTLWRLPTRFAVMKQDDIQGITATRETYCISKILIAYLQPNTGEVDLIFEILSLFVHESVMDLSFLRSFFMNDVALNYSFASKRKILEKFIKVFSDASTSTAMKVMALRHVVNPIVFATLMQPDTCREVLDADIITQLDQKVWDTSVWVRSASDLTEENQYMEDSLRIELLQMTAAILQHAPQILAENQKKVIKFGWSFLPREDTTTKQASCVLLARFIAAFETPSKLVLKLYLSLLGAHAEESEARPLVKQGFDILAPILPKRVPAKESESVPEWVQLTRKKIVEDKHSVAQMVNVYQFLVRHPDLFYDYREHFLPQMANAIPRLCLIQNSTPENKLLAVELAELILKWEKIRLAGPDDKTGSVPEKRPAEEAASPRKKVQVEGPDGVSRGVSVETSKEYVPPTVLRESVVGYLVRQACATLNPADPVQRRILKRLVDLLHGFLTPSVWADVHVKFFHLERTLAAKEILEVQVPSVCSALAILSIDIAHKPTEWFIINMNQLSRLLESSIKSDVATIQTNLSKVLTRIFRAIHETVAAESTEQESQHPDVTAFVSLIDSKITDGITSMDNPFGVLKLLEAASSSRPEHLDSFVPGIVKILQKLTKDVTSETKPNDKTDETNLLLCLKLLKMRVSHLGDQRRWFLTCLGQLIEKPVDTPLLREILSMLSEWTLEKTETFPTIKEKASLLVKMLVLEGSTDRQAAEDYLKLVIKIYSDPSFARSELTVRLEQAFLLGTRNPNPEIRMQFMRIFDRNVGRSPYARLSYILGTQNWEPLSNSFWIHQALDLLLGAVKAVTDSSEPHSLKIKSIKILGGQPESSAKDTPPEMGSIIATHRAFLQELQNYETMNVITLAKQLHYLDREVASKLWVDLFPECWALLSSTERHDLAKMITHFLAKDYHNKQIHPQPNIIQVLLTGFTRAEPIVKLPPYLIKHLGQTHNAWHTAMEILRASSTLTRSTEAAKDDKMVSERTLDALGEMYSSLNEQDMVYGLWKRRGSYEETKAAIVCEQMGHWAEAQHLYELAQINARSGVLPFTESEYSLWDDHWVSCTQKLEQWDILRDLAEHDRSPNLLMECAWRLTNWSFDADPLEQALHQIPDAPTARHKIFEALLVLIKTRNYDERPIEFERVWKEGLQLSLQKWQALPSIVSQSHITLLHEFQQFRELDEARLIFRNLAHAAGPLPKERSSELKTFLQTWRERVPNDWDDISLWSDLTAWRQHIFNAINRTYRAYPMTPTDDEHAMFIGCSEAKWTISRFARVAREHHLYDTCLNVLAKCDTISGPRMGDVADTFTRMMEMAQCHYDNPASNWEANNMLWEKSPQFLSSQKIAILTLRGMFRSKAGQYSEANMDFSQAVILPIEEAAKSNMTKAEISLPTAWEQWGRYNEKLFNEQPSKLSEAKRAVGCYLQAAGMYKNHKARKLFLRVLCLLGMDEPNNTISSAFSDYKGERADWYWVAFIPQLLQAHQPEAQHVHDILGRIAKEYPQALHFQLRTATRQLLKKADPPSTSRLGMIPEDPVKEEQQTPLNASGAAEQASIDIYTEDIEMQESDTPSGKVQETPVKKEGTPLLETKSDGKPSGTKRTLEDLMATLKTGHPLLALSMETMVDQIQFKFKPQPDEDMYRLVVALYNEGLQHLLSGLSSPNKSTEFTHNFIKNITRYANNLYPGHMKTAFMNDFAKDELDLEENVAKLRLWRDKFEAMLDARPRRQRLEIMSHYLAEFQHQKFDDVEIPGQYLLLKENANDFLRIDRFLPEVDVLHIHGNYSRRLTIRGHDGSLHPFVIQNPAARQFRREERLMQLFRLLNMDLDRQKASRSRSLFFNLPAIIPLAPNVRMVEDDPSYCSLYDMYEDHCDASQIHKEAPLVHYVEKLKMSVGQMQDDLVQVKADTNEEITNTMVPPTILSKYMLRAMGSYGDYWMLRKQFTLQYATATFMSYLFSIGERTPQKIYISRDTGSVWVADMLPGWKQDKFAFDHGEAVPFRLTPNIEEFITPVGMEGLFKSCLAVTAQSLTAPELDLKASLSLFVRDEYVAWTQTQQRKMTNAREVIRASVEAIVKKAIYMACKSEHGQETKPNEQNVTELISQASNPHILADMSCTWMPWM